MALDLRLAVAKAVRDCEDPIGEWEQDAHGRPIQRLDFEVLDADGNLVAQVQGTLRLRPIHTPHPDGSITSTLPTRKQLIDLMRNPPPAGADSHDEKTETERIGSEQ